MAVPHGGQAPEQHDISSYMTSDRAVYPLDRNHTGIRLTVLLTLLAVGAASVLGMRLALPTFPGTTEGLSLCLSLVGALVVGLAATSLVERFLLKHWPSGRSLEIGPNSIRLIERSGASPILNCSRAVDVLTWYFILPHDRSGTRKGWYCLACRLSQDDSVIVPYAFMKPDDVMALPQWAAFQRLTSRKDTSNKGSETLFMTEDSTRLRSAEDDRWMIGGEVSPQDFTDFVARLDAQLPYWPPERRE